MKYVVSFLFICYSFNVNYAQENRATHYSSWNTLNVEHDINDSWSANLELNLRRTNFLKDWEQFIIRPFIHYKFEGNLDIALGYSYIEHYTYASYSTPIDAVENNIFQQLTIKHKFSKFTFDHRLRFEERFKDNVIELSEGVFVKNGIKHRNRFRYKFQAAVPIKRFFEDRVLSLVVYDEAHLDFGNGLRPEKLDQNWMFLGVSLRASKNLKIRTGYHDIYAKRGDFFINNQVWETTITYRI